MGENEYDDQVKEGFTKLQKQMFEAKQVISMEEEAKALKERQMEIASTVLKRLKAIDEAKTMYRQIGRAYVVSTKEDEIKRMEKTISECAADVKKSEEKKKYVMRSLEDAQKNLREMVAARK
uniref:Prefoldin subunit n=1 Tax=Panagrolaimus superbus TaxID=310955 RepID=A0A914YT23_9BILA